MKKKRLYIRVDDLTYNRIMKDSKKAEKSISEYLREKVLSMDIRTDPEIKKVINDLRKEINRIGVNINQIAKNTNAGIYSDSDRMHLIESQNELLEEFSKMKERVYSTS